MIETEKTVLLQAFILVMIGDLAIPYALAPFYRGYSHRKMVMSLLGNSCSPVRVVYNLWLTAGGIVFTAGAVVFSLRFMPISRGFSVAMLGLLLVFALGAMVLSGLFSVGETKEMVTLPAKIHGIGASLGFMALLFVPLLLAILSGKKANTGGIVFCAVSFILALISFVLFIMADKEDFSGTVIDQEGTWQRLTLLFLYCPIIHHALRLL